ncbi:hypothetical protein C8Q78DRAFT_511207 [Trametes maxima]|nr:hypothetical protein C8Q78DRAFT_511207 [Trametes maxima]
MPLGTRPRGRHMLIVRRNPSLLTLSCISPVITWTIQISCLHENCPEYFHRFSDIYYPLSSWEWWSTGLLYLFVCHVVPGMVSVIELSTRRKRPQALCGG